MNYAKRNRKLRPLAVGLALLVAAFAPAALAQDILVVLPPFLDFGEVAVGEASGLQTISLFFAPSDPGNFLDGIATTDGDGRFRIVAGASYSLDLQNPTHEISVIFEPTTEGPAVGLLDYDNVGGTIGFVSLSGRTPLIQTGTGLVATADSGAIVMGLAPVGGSVANSVPFEFMPTIFNKGEAPVIGQATVLPPFFIVSGGDYNLGIGESQMLGVEFRPLRPGTFEGLVHFSGTDIPSTILIQGTTVAPNVEILLDTIEQFDTTGESVSSLPDVNGDGQDDFISVTPQGAQGPSPKVYDGATGDFLYSIADRLTANGAIATDRAVGVPDATGDGRGDIIALGQPIATRKQTGAFGMVTLDLYDGANGSHVQSFTLPEVAAGGTFNALFSPLGSIRDVDGDGLGDVIVGFEESFGTLSGRVLVYSSANPGLPLYELFPPDLGNDFAFFGTSISDVPDLNNDGTDDIVVGQTDFLFDPTADPSQTNLEPEVAAIIYSGATGEMLRELVSPVPVRSFFALMSGKALAGIEDINQDGAGDVAVLVSASDPFTSTMPDPNAPSGVVVFSGATGAVLFTYTPPRPPSTFYSGIAVEGMRDYNGDGTPDILLSGLFFNGSFGNQGLIGRADIVDGRTGGALGSAGSPIPSDGGLGSFFGLSVASLDQATGNSSALVLNQHGSARNFDTLEQHAYIYRGQTSSVALSATPPLIDFGVVDVGQLVVRPVQLRNTGTQSGTVTIDDAGPFGSVNGLTITVPAGATLLAPIAFAPSEIGEFVDTLNFTTLSGLAVSVGVHGQAVSAIGTVVGSVMTSGGNVGCATVSIRGIAPADFEASAIVRQDGSFRIRNVPTDMYRLAAFSAGFESQAMTINVTGNTDPEYDLVLDATGTPPSVFGRINAMNNGRFLGGIRVAAFVGGSEEPQAVVFTCADGRYELFLDLARKVPVRMVMTSPDFSAIDFDLGDLDGGSSEPDLDFGLIQSGGVSGAIEGTVESAENGTAIAAAEIRVSRSSTIFSDTSGSDGGFSMTDLTPGQYEMEVFADGFAIEEFTVDVFGGETAGISVALGESTAEGSTEGATEGSTEGATEGSTEGSTEGATEGSTEGTGETGCAASSFNSTGTIPGGDWAMMLGAALTLGLIGFGRSSSRGKKSKLRAS